MTPYRLADIFDFLSLNPTAASRVLGLSQPFWQRALRGEKRVPDEVELALEQIVSAVLIIRTGDENDVN